MDSYGDSFAILPKLESVNTLVQSVYKSLKQGILTGRLKPGQKLIAAKISEELGVSRMPVREAIQRLANEGFAKKEPRKGAVVNGISLRDVEEIYNIRILLEDYAMKLAVTEAATEQIDELQRILCENKDKLDVGDLDELMEFNNRYHRVLFSLCGSEKLTGLLIFLWEQCIYFQSIAHSLGMDWSLSQKHHEELVDALRRRDMERVSKVSYIHTVRGRDVLIEYLKTQDTLSGTGNKIL